MDEEKVKQRILSLMKKGFLISPALLESIAAGGTLTEENFALQKDILVINNDSIELLKKFNSKNLNWSEFERSRAKYEKSNNGVYSKFVGAVSGNEPHNEVPQKSDTDIKFEQAYKEVFKKREVQDFVSYFNSRYKSLESMLRKRRELENVTSVSRIKNKAEREQVAVIGLVSEKNISRNDNMIFTIEDPTGQVKVLVNKNKKDICSAANDIMLDEVIGVVGVSGKNIIFANEILFPEIPLNQELKKYPVEKFALFLSDLHVGSINFLKEEFMKFLEWINGRTGNQKQRELANKVEYVFILGDLVDGVGVYPNQNEELEIKDIYKQYEACAEYLKQIPSDKKIIIIPGNHDAMRIAEPQPPLYKDLAEPIWKMTNTTMLGNPAFVNILSSKDFSGFNFLLYHGYSFTYYADNVESIRAKGGVDRADLIMKYVLKRRHLAPTHSSSLYIPNPTQDSLVLEKVPDFFVTGHLHKSIVSHYKNITMISGSCWQSKTSFMEKIGIHPEPARVPIVNLQTRDIKILRFGK